MLANNFINPMLPVLKSSDTVGDALNWMEEYRIGQLPLIHEQEYQGLISQDVLIDADEDLPLLALQPEFEEVFVNVHQHTFEILKIVQQYNLQAIVVLDEEQNFAGTISVQELLTQFSKSLGSQEIGAVLEIAVENRSYSLSEISRLIESNNVKIISSYYTSGGGLEDSKDILTLKLNQQDISRVIATLERFEYDIVGAYNFEEITSPDKERYNMLMKYLDI
ncbi:MULTISPECIES: CBS domain-containing protein [Arcicella]|uniref:CBS domain-containing protein n=1 Tax=Arcicella aquatica TaxID=217141 RepID=A0ABU5QKP1_9BACT|nr:MULTISPECIES: CBS domain-containing protein [Arcicella]MDR6559973.1 putative transcriptional regulator [Arcicella sp. BE51]MDR6810420.1 putative transcriptional regulator [Arcicella sp. BE140]MDR6821770.1 putative transcriptional regulator [Arcicella sp. BE139]MEA5257414.1 CBS domain-containing protein [Arcicella aquatica]